MSKAALKSWVERKLGETIQDPIWDLVTYENEDLIEGACSGKDEERNALLRRVRRFRRAFKEARENPVSQHVEEKREVYTEAALRDARADALAEQFALTASIDERVIKFRQEILEGERLTIERAYKLVRSLAAARFPLQWFKDHEISVIDHQCSTVSERWNVDKRGLYVKTSFRVDPHGIILRTKKYKNDYGFFYVFDKLIDKWERYKREQEQYKPDDEGYGYKDLDVLRFPFEEAPFVVNETSVFAGSVLDELRRISVRLCDEAQLPWKLEEAAWFVLTDEAPKIDAIEMQFESNKNARFDHGIIQMRIAPWISAEDVTKSYRAMQKRVLGRKAQPISERNAAVFHFFVARLRTQFRKAFWEDEEFSDSWRTRVRDWNQKYPKGHPWHYENNLNDKAVRNFQRDIMTRAGPSISHPRYKNPERPS